jgi:hypothetical protein
MILLYPGPTLAETTSQLAPRRFVSLDGLRLGLLGNTKLNADNILDAVGQLLSERYKIASIVHNKKPSFSHPAPDTTVDAMTQQCDLVIAGVGD